MNMQRLKHWGQIGLITVVVIGVFAGGSVHAKVYEKSQDSRSSQNSAEGKNGQPGSKKGDTNFISAGATLVADQIEDINKPWWKKGWDLVKDYTKMGGAYVEDKAKQVWDGGVAAAKWTGDKIVAGYNATGRFIVTQKNNLKNRIISWMDKGELLSKYGGSRDFTGGSVEDYKKLKQQELDLLEKIKKKQGSWDKNSQEARTLTDLEKLIKAREMAYISQDVYQDNNPNKDILATMGWKKMDDGDLSTAGLDPSIFKISDSKLRAVLLFSKKSDFKSALYFNKDTNTFVIAYKGTNMWSGEDWYNDIVQGTGVQTPYYKKALEISDQVSGIIGKKASVEVTGHSLGGGLATAACVKIKVECTVFNPAGLSDATIKRTGNYEVVKKGHWYTLTKDKIGVKEKPEINAIRVKGEVLTSTQDAIPVVPDTLGSKLTIWPKDRSGEYKISQSLNPIGLHLMDDVISSTDSQIYEDKQYLNSLVTN